MKVMINIQEYSQFSLCRLILSMCTLRRLPSPRIRAKASRIFRNMLSRKSFVSCTIGWGMTNGKMPRMPKIKTSIKGNVLFIASSYSNNSSTGSVERSPNIEAPMSIALMTILPRSSPLIAPNRRGSRDIYAEAA